MAPLTQAEIDELTCTLRSARGESAVASGVGPPTLRGDRSPSVQLPTLPLPLGEGRGEGNHQSRQVSPGSSWASLHDHFRKNSGWLLSATIHAVVLIVLGSLIVPNRATTQVAQLDAELTDPELVPDVAELATIEIPQAALPAKAGAAGTLGAAEVRGALAWHSGGAVGAVSSDLHVATPAIVGESGKGQKTVTADFPTRIAELGPVGPAARFFGSVAYGDRFVFVLDCSGSMGDGNRFPRAVQELLHTLDGMNEEQSFQVVLFDSEARPLVNETGSTNDLFPATADNKQRLATWLAAIQPRGWTDPRLALQLAISLRPSAIFLLSDGEFKIGPVEKKIGHQTLQRVQKQNRDHTPIHTLAFEDRANAGILRAMAKGSGGTYRYVPPLDHNAGQRDSSPTALVRVVQALQ